MVTVEDRGRAVHPCVVEATFADGTKQRQAIPATAWATTTRQVVTFAGEASEVQLDPDVQSLDSRRDNGSWKKSR